MGSTSWKVVETIVKAADDKSAQNIVVMNVASVTPIADYFIVMNGKNPRQINAIVDAIIEAAEKSAVTVKHIAGKNTGKWTLIDLGDIVVHVFSGEERAYYNLEKLWSDATFEDISDLVAVK